MAVDPMKRRCAWLLWNGYEAAGREDVILLDGAAAEAAAMPTGTHEHRVCMYHLEAMGAIVEEPVQVGIIGGFTPYRITARGFALLREVGYPSERFF